MKMLIFARAIDIFFLKANRGTKGRCKNQNFAIKRKTYNEGIQIRYRQTRMDLTCQRSSNQRNNE